MAYQLTIRVTLRCLKHPHYNPARGEAAIKGGCPECIRTLEGYRRALAMAEEFAKIPGVKVTGGRRLMKAA